jgi:hypothetical protein
MTGPQWRASVEVEVEVYIIRVKALGYLLNIMWYYTSL